MNDIDKKIQAALQAGNSADALGAEPNLAEEIIGTFRGRYRWLSLFAVIINFVVFAVTIWTALQFYRAGSVPEQLRWGGLTLILVSMLGMLKLWFWLEMHTNRVLRELKRVELLVLTQRSR